MSETTAKYPIRAVARLTGLTSHVIRAWEKRYQAVVPQRTDTNRRVYSEEDVEKLRILKQATEVGHSIGQIAQKPIEELRELMAGNRLTSLSHERAAEYETSESVQFHIDNCLQAVGELDGEKLDFCLRRASVALSQPILLEQMIAPLMVEIGKRWESGKLRVAHEHLAAAIVRNFLGNLSAGFSVADSAPVIVIGTPIGQEHELGAVLSSMTALAQGWRVTYVGANLPATDFAVAVEKSGARAIGLSVIYPPDDPRLANELKSLRALVNDNIRILVGGRAAGSYKSTLAELGMAQIRSLTELREALAEIRSASYSS